MTEPPSIEESFARRMRERRERLGISTRALADRMQERGFDWHHNTVLRTENAQRPVRLNEAFALSVILRTELMHMVRGDQTPTTVKLMRLQIDALSRQVVKTSELLKEVEGDYDEARLELEFVEDRFQRIAEKRTELEKTLAISVAQLEQWRARMGEVDTAIDNLNARISESDDNDGPLQPTLDVLRLTDRDFEE